jgi:hypothetical protein
MPFNVPERSQGHGERSTAAPQAERAAPKTLVVRRRPAGRLRPSQVPVRSPQEVLGGPGRPLTTPLREEMEGRLGADFSTVRVHADSAARASAAELGARAYTAGEHVVVGDGGADRKTLAHELSHVLQQRRGAVTAAPVAGAGHDAGLKVSHPRDAQERAAEESAARVMRAVPSGPGGAAAGTGALAGPAPRQPGGPGPAAVVQRMLDERWMSKAALKTKEGVLCHNFAQRVSDFVDEAHKDLLTGNVKGWKGIKIATFVSLLIQGKSTASAWAGNAIEERVYALMKKHGMPLKWTPQQSESMGSASFPDIVIHLPGTTDDGLVDITSDRLHIERKAGGWFGASHIYVAEAYFDPVTAEQLPIVLANLKAGGVDEQTAKDMAAAALAKRKAAEKARKATVSEARKLANKYTSGKEFIEKAFKGNKKQARQFLLEHGLKKKGVTGVGATKRRKARKLSDETKKQRARKIREKRKEIAKPTLAEVLKKLGPPVLSDDELEQSADELEQSADELEESAEEGEEEGEEEDDSDE